LTALRLALADLSFDRLRTALSIAGLASVIVCAMLLGATANALSDFLDVPSTGSNLLILDGNYVDPSDSTLPDEVMRAAEALGPQLVSRVSPLFFRQLRVNDRLVQVRAAPLADWATAQHMVLQSGRRPAIGNEVVIGEGLAASAGWTLGTPLVIYGRPMTVTGIYRSPGVAFAAVYMPFESARDLFGPERLTQIISVQVAPGADAATVLTRLASDPAISGRFAVFYEDAYTRRNTEMLRDLLGLVYVASGLAFLAVGLGAYMATALHLAERPRESALLRLSGFSRGQVGIYLLLRTEMLAALAFCIGVPLASAWMGALYAQGPAYVFNVPVRPTVDPGLVAVFAMMTALSALAGALISTGGLMRASVAQGLRS
jgi:hypothetical protein